MTQALNKNLTVQQLFDLAGHKDAVIRYAACQEYVRRGAVAVLTRAGRPQDEAARMAAVLAERLSKTAGQRELDALTPELILQNCRTADDRPQRYERLAKALIEATDSRQPVEVYVTLPEQPQLQLPAPVTLDLTPLVKAVQAQTAAYREMTATIVSALREPKTIQRDGDGKMIRVG
jgi:hypothetical protein